MEVELMVTKRDDRPTDQQGEYRAICLGKVGRQSFAICCSNRNFGKWYITCPRLAIMYWSDTMVIDNTLCVKTRFYWRLLVVQETAQTSQDFCRASN